MNAFNEDEQRFSSDEDFNRVDEGYSPIEDLLDFSSAVRDELVSNLKLRFKFIKQGLTESPEQTYKIEELDNLRLRLINIVDDAMKVLE